MTTSMSPRVVEERQGHVLLLGLNRPTKLNAFDLQMLKELAAAYDRYEADASLRCAVLYGIGDHFTAGLDLAEVGPSVEAGHPIFPPESVDPLETIGKKRSKPLITAVHGWCLTIGIELMLASDIRVAANNTKMGQIEIKRGIFPFGGATVRWPQVTGWGNAMRYLLTGDILEAKEAWRIGLVQELTEPGEQLSKALELAHRIAKQAPLGVQATLASARSATNDGPQLALNSLQETAIVLMKSRDAEEGMRSFVERREAKFTGH